MARYTRPPRPTDSSRARSAVAVRQTVAPVLRDSALTTGTRSNAGPDVDAVAGRIDDHLDGRVADEGA